MTTAVVDQTAWFKARARTITQRKAKSESPQEEKLPVRPRASYEYSTLSEAASEIGGDLARLGQELVRRRAEYLSFNAPINAMTDVDRDQFDRITEEALRQLSGAIGTLDGQISRGTVSAKTERQHLAAVVQILKTYTKRIATIVTEMRKLRVRNSQNRHQVWKLASLVQNADKKALSSGRCSSLSMASSGNDREATEFQRENETRKSETKIRKRHGNALGNMNTNNTNSEKENISERKRRNSKQGREQWDEEIIENLENLNPAEKSQLMAENERIYEKFANVHAEIDCLETQISEIQRLQENFADKIMDQERDIEIVNETAVATTENLIDGNEWIRQAISNSAGRRVVVLFCIIVITFTLLFLDWYNV